MTVRPTAIPEVLVFEPKLFGDPRGFFVPLFNARDYEAAGLRAEFVQDNLSFSTQGVLRGLHFQNPGAQGKLVSVLQGEVFDVAVDIRLGSPTFGKWVGEVLSSENRRQLWIPEGFAHGFVVTGESALFHYKCSAYYSPATEGTVQWDDPDIGIDWPMREVSLSPKDEAGISLANFPREKLPVFSQVE
jgi:dTDP-4-dehydrorhamnose 3,5-epimerase